MCANGTNVYKEVDTKTMLAIKQTAQRTPTLTTPHFPHTKLHVQ